MAAPDATRPAPELSGNGPQDIESLAAIDISKPKDKPGQAQAENDAPSITCASLRCDALREATEIELDRLQVIILTAKSFNRNGLDDDADEVLRDVWRSLRVFITPVRTELQKLRGTGQ